MVSIRLLWKLLRKRFRSTEDRDWGKSIGPQNNQLHNSLPRSKVRILRH